jgi:hypothetical protein
MKTELFTKVIKTPSCKACFQRPSGLIKREGVMSKHSRYLLKRLQQKSFIRLVAKMMNYLEIPSCVSS